MLGFSAVIFLKHRRTHLLSGVTKHRSGNGEVVPHLADLVQAAKGRQSDFPSSVADA